MSIVKHGIAATVLATWCHMASGTAAQAKDYIIALTPVLGTAQERKDIGIHVDAFVHGPRVRPGDRIVVINGLDRNRIALLSVPDHPLYKNEASRRKVLQKGMAEFLDFLVKPATTGAQPAALNVPKVLRDLASVLPGPAASTGIDLLLVGSPLHIDAQQPSVSMINARVPADSHLFCTLEESAFGLDSATKPLRDVRVHWLTKEANWQGDLHELKVRRMWGAYVDVRGGALIQFNADAKASFDAFAVSANAPLPVSPPLERADCRPTMNIVRRLAENKAVEPMFVSTDVRRTAIPAAPSKLRIALRWERAASADIDLYAKTKSAKSWIYFGEPETPDGKFFKFDGDPTKPSKGFEYIEFDDVLDPSQIQIAINFYEGHIAGGPKGQIRLDLGGSIHEIDFHIRGSTGNKGLGFPDKMNRHPAWVIINAADIVAGKLSFTSTAP